MLIPIFQEHNHKVEALVGQDFAPVTLERYKTSLKHTQEFIIWKYKVSDIDITEIDHRFISDYDFKTNGSFRYWYTQIYAENYIQKLDEAVEKFV